MQKTLLLLGAILILIGVLWPWLGKLPLGRLPGDIIIDKPNMKIYIPITTMVVVGIILSIIAWIFRK